MTEFKFKISHIIVLVLEMVFLEYFSSLPLLFVQAINRCHVLFATLNLIYS